MKCRFDGKEINNVFIDLGFAPLSNAFLSKEDLLKPEKYLPLKVFVCDKCLLVQTQDFMNGEEIFKDDYVYFSSYSTSWLTHSKKYVEMMVEKYHYNESSLIMEVASNDGYLLQYFKELNIPVLGVEPTLSTARISRVKGIETIVQFFDEDLATEMLKKDRKFDLIIGNNVLAHNQNINNFIKAIKIVLKDNGVVTMEFPHLMKLISENQFDTIYHEHFSYFSFSTVKKIFLTHGLEIFDVEELETHGGSLRIFAKHAKDNSKKISRNVSKTLKKEEEEGMLTVEYYYDFSKKVERVKNDLVSFLIKAKRDGKKVVAYGAAAKGNTFLNYAGIRSDLIPYVIDVSPHKQGKFLPGSHIPVVGFEKIKEYKPDFLLIFPWNLIKEISEQHSYIKSWGGKFVTAIPKIKII